MQIFSHLAPTLPFKPSLFPETGPFSRSISVPNQESFFSAVPKNQALQEIGFMIVIFTQNRCLKSVLVEVWNIRDEESENMVNPDNGVMGREKEGRRSGMDRRQFTALEYRFEHRSGQDRRSGTDRRRRGLSVLDSVLDRWTEFPNPFRGLFYAAFLSLPIWTLFLILKGTPTFSS